MGFTGIMEEGSRGEKWVSFTSVLIPGVSATNHLFPACPAVCTSQIRVKSKSGKCFQPD